MKPRNLYLGFDGGGTKTECALLDADGRVLGKGVGGPSNPLRAGFEIAFASLRAAAIATLVSGSANASELSAICAGLAGAGRPKVVKRVMTFLVEEFPGADVHVTTDFDVALEAAAGTGPAVVLIAGTGSVAVGRDGHGRMIRAGGAGPWVGDAGSAFDIGRNAVAAVARARDALGPVSMLADMIPDRLQCPLWEQLIERIAQNPDGVFTSVFPLVVEAADAEDPVAREVLLRAALDLSRIAASVIRRLDLDQQEFVLAKSGGVHGRSAFLDSALENLLRTAAPRASIMPLPQSPAIGAARLAMRLLAHPAEEAVHDRA